MSSEFAVQIEGVGKTYRIYAKPHHRLMQAISGEQRGRWFTEFRALSNVSFDVGRGETVGIIGKNGSGKSTLLQILCGTLQPTEGRVRIEGRVAALLELGAGFNPEFTGRENVFLNAAVMGLSREEVLHRFDEIVGFADIGEHLDHPVKTYSSGMYIRLAFAVAISVAPDVLIVDEALSVGDEAFQRKCFARIEELKRNGCTILFVSHSASSIVQLCDRAVLLDGGELLTIAAPKDAVALYQRLLYAPLQAREAIRESIRSGQLEADASDATELSSRPTREVVARMRSNDTSGMERFESALRSESRVEYESHGAIIIDPHLVNETGARVNFLVPEAVYLYRYEVEFTAEARDVHFGMMIKSMAGVELFGMGSHADGEAEPSFAPGMRCKVEFRFHSRFLPGVYFTNAGCVGKVADGEEKFLHRVLDAYMFKVEERSTNRRKAGFYDLSSEPSCLVQVVS